MKSLLLAAIVFFLTSGPLTGFAAKVSHLYQAQLPVTAQTDEIRRQAEVNGLIQVLIKLTGNPEIEQNPTIKTNLARADYYVQEFSYAAATPNTANYTIQINYNPDEIKRLLRQAGASYWGENRPLILVWMAVKDEAQPHAAEIINDTASDILFTMQQQSKKYGLPIIFPIMDVTDVNQVTSNEIINKQLPLLKTAGQRYSPDAMLIGYVQHENGSVQSKWELVLNDNKWQWHLSDKTMDGVIFALMNQMSQTLAKQFIVKADQTSQFWLTLEVSNIAQRDDLTKLIQYLKQLTLVQQVQLLQVSGDTVELSLLVRGSLETFQDNAILNQRLVLKSADTANNRLIYEWTH
ncbi:MAG TPA: DUF2066 domain-containing protein [Gammaproteobacteria bacterium]|jgi:hypothetical protein|nr:DUF2066 domain-containing protein [Gammaproteobacteria bacterium]